MGGSSSNKHIMKWEQLEVCLKHTLGHGCRLCLTSGFGWPGSVGFTTGCSPAGMTGVSLHTVTVKWPGGFGTAAPEDTLIYRPSDMHISQGKAFCVHLPCSWRGFTNVSGSAEASPRMLLLSQQMLPALLLIQQRKKGTVQARFSALQVCFSKPFSILG